ncbi:hypothetical protein JOB18_047279 [Solea senegalensis]|uniref:Secreted protein n=1 Tax=Solea senegalensis TaxID=28829 RepID=A0AAV6SKY6_SOLSE|nr:hypothetical protein JOB18_047279 [Solea senegalensis]
MACDALVLLCDGVVTLGDVPSMLCVGLCCSVLMLCNDERCCDGLWFESSQVPSQALQSCDDLILHLSAPSAPLSDPKLGERS